MHPRPSLVLFIEIFDTQNGWLSLFGVNSRGDFVGMPTWHPYDSRSDQSSVEKGSILMADIELLLEKMLEESSSEFDVADAFAVLKATFQEVCPTVVSIVYDATEHKAYWCENRQWNQVNSQKL